MKNYIGITGFKTKEEIHNAAETFRKAGINNGKYTAMFGILISGWQLKERTRESRRNPALIDVPDLIKEIPEEYLPVIHYCSHNADFKAEHVINMFKNDIYARCKAMQLNTDWPESSELAKLKENFKELQIILQYDPRTLLAESAAKKILKEYTGLVDRILIDPSLGAGIPFNEKETGNILNTLKNAGLESFIVAGGLSGDNVHRKLSRIKEIYKGDFSVDAEGQLRTQNDQHLSAEKVNSYIKETARILRK